MKAVILAGGKGTRLAPYTKVIPKPLMPIGDMPILEVLLWQMKEAGIIVINYQRFNWYSFLYMLERHIRPFDDIH